MRALVLVIALGIVMLVTCAADVPTTPARLARAAIEGAGIAAIAAVRKAP